jgi:hypothetical protein
MSYSWLSELIKTLTKVCCFPFSFLPFRSRLTRSPQVAIFLPELFQLYIRSLRTHSSSVFPLPAYSRNTASSSRSVQETHAVFKLRSASFFFLRAAAPLVESRPDSTLRLVQLLERESLYASSASSVATSWLETLKSIARRNAEFTDGNSLASTLGIFVVLLRLDGAAVEPLLPAILRTIASDNPTKAHEGFMLALLSYHAKTRALPAFLALVLATIDQVAGDYPTVMNGPLASVEFTRDLEKELSRSLLPTQVLPALKELLGRFTERLGEKVEARPPAKKRRVSGTAAAQGDEAVSTSEPFRALPTAHMLVTFVNAAPVSSADKDTVQKMVKDFSQETLVPGLERLLREGNAGRQPAAVVALLRVWTSLSSKLRTLAINDEEAGLDLPGRVVQLLSSLLEGSADGALAAEERLEAVSGAPSNMVI